jgi:FlaA1/EpsC-like NDP-sugar epimerase
LASRKLVLIFGLLAVSGLMLWRGIYAVLFVQPNFYRRVLVFGAGTAGQALVAALAQISPVHDANPLRGTGYQVAGFVDDDAAKHALSQVAGVPMPSQAAYIPAIEMLSWPARFGAVDVVTTTHHSWSWERFPAHP